MLCYDSSHLCSLGFSCCLLFGPLYCVLCLAIYTYTVIPRIVETRKWRYVTAKPVETETARDVMRYGETATQLRPSHSQLFYNS